MKQIKEEVNKIKHSGVEYDKKITKLYTGAVSMPEDIQALVKTDAYSPIGILLAQIGLNIYSAGWDKCPLGFNCLSNSDDKEPELVDLTDWTKNYNEALKKIKLIK